MAQLILLYSLKDDVSSQDFENWVKTVDYPQMRGLERVNASLHTAVQGRAITAEQHQKWIDQLEGAIDLSALSDVDLVIEQQTPGLVGLVGCLNTQQSRFLGARQRHRRRHIAAHF